MIGEQQQPRSRDQQDRRSVAVTRRLVSEDWLSRVQLIEQRLGLSQIKSVKPFGEPAVDRSEEIAGRFPLPLIAPETRHAHGGP